MLPGRKLTIRLNLVLRLRTSVAVTVRPCVRVCCEEGQLTFTTRAYYRRRVTPPYSTQQIP